MRLRILAIGRLKNGPEARLIDEYRRRMRWKLAIEELDPRGHRAKGSLSVRETALFRAALSPSGEARRVTVGLDEAGVHLASGEFAARLASWRDQGVAEVAFLVGGADGLDPGLLSGADLRLSLGRMTWPHALARVLLVEQLYRAQQIIAGHPYHRE